MFDHCLHLSRVAFHVEAAPHLLSQCFLVVSPPLVFLSCLCVCVSLVVAPGFHLTTSDSSVNQLPLHKKCNLRQIVAVTILCPALVSICNVLFSLSPCLTVISLCTLSATHLPHLTLSCLHTCTLDFCHHQSCTIPETSLLDLHHSL